MILLDQPHLSRHAFRGVLTVRKGMFYLERARFARLPSSGLPLFPGEKPVFPTDSSPCFSQFLSGAREGRSPGFGMTPTQAVCGPTRREAIFAQVTRERVTHGRHEASFFKHRRPRKKTPRSGKADTWCGAQRRSA